MLVFKNSTRYSPPVLMKLEFFQQVFEKYLSINFMKIRPVEAELFLAGRPTDGRTDRHKETDCRFSQLCERA
jgi:hypothetical protein